MKGYSHKSQRKLAGKKDSNCVKKGWRYSYLISPACRFGGKDLLAIKTQRRSY